MVDRVRKALELYVRELVWPAPRRAAARREAGALVNGRGQLLSLGLPGQAEHAASPADLGLWGPERRATVDALFAALRADALIRAHAHCCQNDGGACFIQAPDLDEAALRAYVLMPFLGKYAVSRHAREFDAQAFSDAFDQVFGALRAPMTERRLVTPVLGVEPEAPLRLSPGVSVRPPSEDEQIAWSHDGSLERGLLRDLLTCRCIVEVRYDAEWPPARNEPGQPIDVGTFDAPGVERALELSQDAVALMRVVTGGALPLIYTEDAIVALPWVTNRFFHRPMLADVRRRHDWSPLWVRIVDAMRMTDLEAQSLVELWNALRSSGAPQVVSAIRLFTLERDFVNLYRIFEIVQDTGKDLKRWASKNEMSRFSQTANSPDAIGDAWARHGHRNPPPATPMSWDDADALVRRLLVGVLR